MRPRCRRDRARTGTESQTQGWHRPSATAGAVTAGGGPALRSCLPPPMKYLIILPLYGRRRVPPKLQIFEDFLKFSIKVRTRPKCGKNKHNSPNTGESFLFRPVPERDAVVIALPVCGEGPARVLDAFAPPRCFHQRFYLILGNYCTINSLSPCLLFAFATSGSPVLLHQSLGMVNSRHTPLLSIVRRQRWEGPEPVPLRRGKQRGPLLLGHQS